MRNVDFYALAAQILPALLIAIAVEFRSLILHLTEGFHRDMDHLLQLGSEALAKIEFDRRAGIKSLTAMARWETAGFFTGLTFILGEVCSLLVVFVGANTWLVWMAAPVTGLSLLTTTAFAALLPMYLFALTKSERARAFQAAHFPDHQHP